MKPLSCLISHLELLHTITADTILLLILTVFLWGHFTAINNRAYNWCLRAQQTQARGNGSRKLISNSRVRVTCPLRTIQALAYGKPKGSELCYRLIVFTAKCRQKWRLHSVQTTRDVYRKCGCDASPENLTVWS